MSEIDLAASCKQISLRYFPTQTMFEQTDDLSPVTIADQSIEAYMRLWILAAFPDHGIVGEEMEAEEGARYDTHHGMTNGVLFPYVVIANRPVIEAKMVRVARMLGRAGGFDAFLAWILALRAAIGVPETLGDLGVRHEDLGAIAADAVKDPTADANPRSFTAADFAVLIRTAIDGDLSFKV